MRTLYMIIDRVTMKALQPDNSWGKASTCRVFTTKSAATQALNYRQRAYKYLEIVPLKAMAIHPRMEKVEFVDTQCYSKASVEDALDALPDDATYFIGADKESILKMYKEMNTGASIEKSHTIRELF